MKQIVFDMDGVLFATEALSDRLWKEMMEERGTPEMTAALQQCRGRNRTDTRAFFASHYPDFPILLWKPKNEIVCWQRWTRMACPL